MLRRVLALGVLGLVACGGGDSTGPKLMNVSGSWQGVVGSQTIQMTLINNAGVVTGTGTISHTSGPRALTISGTFSSPDVNATMNSGTTQPFLLKGRMKTVTEIRGALTGSGFTGDSITFVKTQ